MSVTFDYSIEKKTESGWKCVAKAEWDDNEIINPYLLREPFYEWQPILKAAELSDNLTEETLLKFSEKIEELPKRSNDSLEKYYAPKRAKPSYPYKRKPRAYSLLSNKPIMEQIDECMELVDCRWTKVIVPMSKVGFRNNFKALKRKFHLSAKSFNDLPNDGCFKYVIISNRTFGWKFSSLALARQAFSCLNGSKKLQEALFSNLPTPESTLTFIRYFNRKKEIPQWELKNVNIAGRKGIEELLETLKKELESCRKANSVENLAKLTVRNFLRDYGEEEDKPSIQVQLEDYVNDADDRYYEEYAEELESQILELKIMLRLMGENGRVIWKLW